MVKKRIVEAIISDDPSAKLWKMRFACARMAYEDGKPEEAERLLFRLLEPAEQLKDHVFAVNATLIGLGAVQLSGRRLSQAKVNFDKAIAALEGASDPLIKELHAVALRFHAALLDETKDVRGAEQELKRAISVLEQLGPEAAVQLAYALSDLGGLCVMQGRFSEAVQFIRKSMRLLADALGSEHGEYMRADMIYQLCTASEEDLITTAETLGIKLQYQFGANHPHMLRALRRYFQALKERGETAKLREAQEIFAAFDKVVKSAS